MLEGRLSEFSLADVFQLLALTRKTGVLRVTTAAEGRVRFDEGAVTCAVADVARPTLGARLGQRHELDPAVPARLADVQRSGDLAALRELVGDVVEQEALAAALREEVADAVFAFMRADDGGFTFESRPPTGTPIVSLDGGDLVEQAGARLTEWDHLLDRIGPAASVPALVPALVTERVTVEADEWLVLARIDGSRTAAALADATGQGEFATYRVLAALLERGLVTVRAPEPVASPDPVTEPELAAVPQLAAVPEPAAVPEAQPEPPHESTAQTPPPPVSAPPAGPVDADEDESVVPAAPASIPRLRLPRVEQDTRPRQAAPKLAVDPPAAPDEDVTLPSAAAWQEALGLVDLDAPADHGPEGDEPAPADSAEPAPTEEPADDDAAAPKWRTEKIEASTDVDRVSMARELAALGFDDAIGPATRTPAGPADPGAPRRLTRDEAVSKGLLLRLIDGVKGA